MNPTRQPPPKITAARAAEAFEALLVEILRPGYWGSATIDIAVADGTIQLLRRRTERIER